jgi:hypothetical protein
MNSGTLQKKLMQKLQDGTVDQLPANFRKAIASDVIAKSLWPDFTPLARNEVGIDKMHNGMGRPCCWPGCRHRCKSGCAFAHSAFRNRPIYPPNPRASATTPSSSPVKAIRIGAQHTSQS